MAGALNSATERRDYSASRILCANWCLELGISRRDRGGLLQVINLDQTYADAAVLAGKDGGELSGGQRGKDSGFL